MTRELSCAMHISHGYGTRGLLARTISCIKRPLAVRCSELLYASQSTQWEGKRAPGRDLMHLARCYVAVGQYEHMTILPRRPLRRKIKRKIIMNERAGCSSLFSLATCNPAYKFAAPIYEFIIWEMRQQRNIRKETVIKSLDYL